MIRSLIVATVVLTVASSYSEVRAATHGLTWGPYTVASDRIAHEPSNRYQVEIRSSQGRLIRDVRGYGRPKIRIAKTGKSQPTVLLISIGNGGNDGLDLIFGYVYSPKVGVKNVIATEGVMDKFVFRDLDGDGVAELVLDDTLSLNGFDHFSRSGIGEIARVYKWRGDRYVDATPRFPTRTLQRSAVGRRQFLNNLNTEETYVRSRLSNEHDSLARSHEDVMAPAILYWANEMAAGRANVAENLFRRRCSKQMVAWLAQRRPLLVRTIKNQGDVMTTDDSVSVGP